MTTIERTGSLVAAPGGLWSLRDESERQPSLDYYQLLFLSTRPQVVGATWGTGPEPRTWVPGHAGPMLALSFGRNETAEEPPTERSAAAAWSFESHDRVKRALARAIGKFEKQRPGYPGVNRHTSSAIIGLVSLLSAGRYPPVLSADDEGTLALEVRLNPEEQLFVEVERTGHVDAVVHNKNSGFETLDVKDVFGLVRELVSRHKLAVTG